jgi:hypothetical protein
VREPAEPQRSNRAKTFEEIAVEETLLLGALFALVPLAILILLTPLAVFLNSLGAAGAVSGYTITFMSLSALCSGLFGLWFRFSHRQFRLLFKFVLAINGGVSVISVVYPHLLFTVLAGYISNPDSPAIVIIGTANLLLIVLLILLRRATGEQISKYFRISYVPASASSDQVSKSIGKAERELAGKNYEAAGEAFHAAAVAYVRLERWREAGEEYWRAADAFSTEEDMAFEASFLYAFAAASFILSRTTGNADRAIRMAEKTLKADHMPDKARKRISEILMLLAATRNREFDKAVESWRSLRRKVKRWSYPFVEETILLLEKATERSNRAGDRDAR